MNRLRLIDNGENWYHILLILSLEKADDFLDDIQFPPNIDLNQIRPTAKTFVEQYATNLHTIHYWKDKEVAEIALANKLYLELGERLSSAELEQFCKWGNQFEINTDLERCVNTIWSRITYAYWNNRLEKPTLTLPSQEILTAIIKTFVEKEKKSLSKLDETEASPRTDWEERALWIYNWGTAYSPIEKWLHPFDYLHSLIRWVEIPPVLKKIQSEIASSDFEAFNRWINEELQTRRGRFAYLDLKYLLQVI